MEILWELIPMARTGARANVVKLGRKGPGVWVADLAAAIARVRPGDELALERLDSSRRPETMHVRVGAVYRNLIRDSDNPQLQRRGRTTFARRIRTGQTPHCFLLMSPLDLYRVAAAVGPSSFRNVYEIPVDPREDDAFACPSVRRAVQ